MDVTYFRSIQKQTYSYEKVGKLTLTVSQVWPLAPRTQTGALEWKYKGQRHMGWHKIRWKSHLLEKIRKKEKSWQETEEESLWRVLYVCAILWHYQLLGLYSNGNELMSIEHWWNDPNKGKFGYWEKNLSQGHTASHGPTWDWNSETNCLSHGTAHRRL